MALVALPSAVKGQGIFYIVDSIGDGSNIGTSISVMTARVIAPCARRLKLQTLIRVPIESRSCSPKGRSSI